MARVLVVDDLADVRVVVRTALRVRGHIEIVGEATTTFSAVELAADLQPDVVVLDLLLPDSPRGQDTYERLRAASPGSKLVIYTGHDADPTWYRNHGAAGFIDKSTGITELVDAVERAGSAA
jgi:DNA-binding NarL/FixJ family response regulator